MIHEVRDGNEHFCDNEGNPIPIDNQYKRTTISNINSEYHKDHPIYGDGYVIFRNIEVDGKSIKFKDKVFNSDGSTSLSSTIEGYQNQSHNIIEIGTVSANSMIDALNPKQFGMLDDSIILKKVIEDVYGFKNDDNKFTLPQKLTLSDTYSLAPISFNFEETSVKQVSDLKDDDLTLKLVEIDGHKNNYHVELAKSSTKELYIKLGEGLHNSGPGNSDYIVLSPSNAGSLSEMTPTISLTKSKNFYIYDNDFSDPFYTLYKSDSGNLYSGNLTVTQSGVIQAIDEYEEDYKAETVEERQKFDVEENIKTNYLKHPIPILWTLVGEPETVENEGVITQIYDTVDANLEYFIKPYFYCVSKDIIINNNSIDNISVEKSDEGFTFTSEEAEAKLDKFNKSVIVLGNNNYLAKKEEGSYFIIPGYNVPHDYKLDEKIKGNRLFKCNFEAISINMENDKNLPKGMTESKEDIIDESGNVVTDESGNVKTQIVYTVNNKSILNLDDNGDYIFDTDYLDNLKTLFDDNQINSSNTPISEISNKNSEDITELAESLFIVTDAIFDEEGNELSPKKIEKISDFSKYFSYSNFNNINSLIDFQVETESLDEDGTFGVAEISEETSRNTPKLNITGDIIKVSINGINDDYQLLIDYTSAYKAIEKLESIYAYIVDETNTEIFGEFKDLNLTNYAYYDHATGMVWSKINASDSIDNASYIASLYYNSDIILSENNLSTTLKIEVLDDDSSDENNTRSCYVSMNEEMPYYKSFTIYKKEYTDESEDGKTNTYFTTSDEDLITEEDKKYLGLVQIIDGDGVITNFTPQKFWDLCAVNEDASKNVIHLDYNDVIAHVINEENTPAIDEENIPDIDGENTPNTNEENTPVIGSKNSNIRFINLINVVETYETTVEGAIYRDSNGNLITSQLGENVIVNTENGQIDISDWEKEETTSNSGFEEEEEEEVSTFSMTRTSEDEIDEDEELENEPNEGEIEEDVPTEEDDSIIVNPEDVITTPTMGIPDAVLVTSYDVDSFVMAPVYWSDYGYHTPQSYTLVDGKKYSDEMSIEDNHCVVIPDHATEIILEIRHYTENNNPIAIFTAKDKDSLKYQIDDSNDFVFNVSDAYEYDSTNGVHKLSIPSISDDNSNRFQPNQFEKCLLYSESNTVNTIKVPLYRSDCENSKKFALRVSGILTPSLTEKLFIRLIGYTA